MPAPLTHNPYTSEDSAIREKAVMLRSILGMTQKEFAANMAVSLSALRHYERGTLRWPKTRHGLIVRDLVKAEAVK